MRTLLLAITLALAVSASLGAPDPRTDPNGWLVALDKARVASEGWPVENLRIELGRAHLDIENGTLVPVRGPAPRAQEFLFLGKARFVLATDDPVETYQIELFTGIERLDEPVTQAVIAIAADEISDALSARPGAAPLAAEPLRRASDLLSSWRGSREYRRSGLRLNALADAIGDPAAERFAAAWCDAPRLGRFLLRVDPYAVEALAVEQFVPLRVGDVDRDAWRRWLHHEQSEGRRLNVDPDDIGNWDVWYSGGVHSAEGRGIAGHSNFESEHYDFDAALDPERASIVGRTAIDVVARTDGARSIQLSLFPDLEVDSLSLRGGPSVPFARSTETILAPLPAATAVGAKLTLEVRYHGVLFERNEDKLWVKRTTTGWYPHVGTVDRATYHAAYEVPAPWMILGSGRKVEGGDGTRQVRQLDKPSAFFGFEIGKFKVLERTLGHVALTIGFLSDQRTASASERETTIDTLAKALAIYEERFGPYPLDDLTVATSHHEFAQGFLGFLTLPEDIIHDVDTKNADALDNRRIIAHELAHQWWGNLVGWASDRDVWLSESLANYAAVFVRRKIEQGTDLAGTSAYLDLVASAETRPMTIVGRSLEEMGPITLGPRLASSLTDEAYQPVVYEKGAKVLAMLAEQLGEDPFLAMLKEIAQRANFRPLDTEMLLAALGKMSGRDLGAFTRSFVHGVGYPEIHYEYTLEPAEGGFTVRGTIHQIPRGFRRDRLVRAGSAGFEVAATFHTFQSELAAEASIPGVVTIAEEAGAAPKVFEGAPQTHAASLRGFKVLLRASGADTPFSFKVPQQPQALHLDPRTMLPTTAVNATLEPKRSAMLRGEALRSVGRSDDARAAFAQALGLPLDPLPDGAPAVRANELSHTTDARNGWIHLDLAELALDDGRLDEAAKELGDRTVSVASESFGDFRYKMLKARIAIHSGDGPTAFKLLNGVLALEAVQKETDTVFDAAHKRKLNSGESGSARDYLVYAAAAHASGHEDVCREASAEAKRRGGDASLLDELHAGPR